MNLLGCNAKGYPEFQGSQGWRKGGEFQEYGLTQVRGAEGMVMKFHGNVRGEVRVNFLALFASKPHIFKCTVPSNCPELFARTSA